MSNVEIPDRGALTDYLLQRLRAAWLQLPDDPPENPRPLIGDGLAPEEAGWPGQPGSGSFVPYLVLVAMPAQRQPGPQSLKDDNRAWMAGFRLTGYGVVRNQPDYLLHESSKLLANIGQVGYDPDRNVAGSYGIQRVEWGNLGGIDRADQVDPKLWSRTDTFNVYLARARDRTNRTG